MKFTVNKPPMGGENTKERLDRITSWLFMLYEKLDVTLSNLGEDNFSPDVREKLFLNKEGNDDNA